MTILEKNPTKPITPVLAMCHSRLGRRSLGNIQSMLYGMCGCCTAAPFGGGAAGFRSRLNRNELMLMAHTIAEEGFQTGPYDPRRQTEIGPRAVSSDRAATSACPSSVHCVTFEFMMPPRG